MIYILGWCGGFGYYFWVLWSIYLFYILKVFSFFLDISWIYLGVGTGGIIYFIFWYNMAG